MTLSLTLPPKTEQRLRERAAAEGQDINEYVSAIVQAAIGDRPTAIELSGDVYQQFLASGMTDDELSEELERAKHEMRLERRRSNQL